MHATSQRAGPGARIRVRPDGGRARAIPVAAAVLALAVLGGDAAAQQRSAVASPTRPRPFATRPMGVPASVQPSGRPLPGPLDRRPPVPPGGVLPVYAYPVYPLVLPPLAYPPVVYWPVAYARRHSPYGYPPLTVVQPRVMRSRVQVTTFTPAVPSGCAVVEIKVSGQRWRNVVPLPSLGASTPDALRYVIAGRLAEGRQAPLQTLNGTRFIIPAGYDPAALTVEPCDDAVADPRDGS